MGTYRTLLVFCVMLMLMTTSGAAASTIYQWVDENGVRHFSNTGIPEEVQDVETAPEEQTTAPQPPAPGESPPPVAPAEGGQPLQPAPVETIEPSEQTQRARERRYEDARETWSERIYNERDQLESQIEAIENRALSRFFTEGMRDAQLKPIKERLDSLNQDPEAYFGQKAPKPQDFGLPEGNAPQ